MQRSSKCLQQNLRAQCQLADRANLVFTATDLTVKYIKKAMYLTTLLTPVTAIATRRHLQFANAGDLATLRTKTVGLIPQSFSAVGPSVWNSLPLELKSTSLTIKTVHQPAENCDVQAELLCMSAPVITLL